jgi:hypothetical protein
VRHPKGTYAGLGLTETSIEMTEQTLVLVDKYGELWCVNWYLKTIHSDIEYFFETYRNIKFIRGNVNFFMQGMGMEELGEL